MISSLSEFVAYTRHKRNPCGGACMFACRSAPNANEGNPAMIGGIIYAMREWAMNFLVVQFRSDVEEAFKAVRA